MADDETGEAIPAAAAEAALAYLAEMSPGLRGAAILGPGGDVLAAGGAMEGWHEGAEALLGPAGDGAAEEEAHADDGDDKLFAVRRAELTAIARTEAAAPRRLTLFDLRSLLRDLGEGAGG